MQFTIRSVMVSIAFMAVALVAELFVHTAVEVVKSHDDYVLWEETAGMSLLEHLLHRGSRRGNLGHRKASCY